MNRRYFASCLCLLCAFPGLSVGQEPSSDESQLKAGPDDAQEKDKPGPVDKDVSEEFKTTASGLKYRVLRKSEKEKPNAKDSVQVHYKGWLDDKTIFDSSYRRGQKIAFPLGNVISGWTEGMQLIGEGGMIELEIPAKLGYGARGVPGVIPPNSTLHFVVELFDIQ